MKRELGEWEKKLKLQKSLYEQVDDDVSGDDVKIRRGKDALTYQRLSHNLTYQRLSHNESRVFYLARYIYTIYLV